MNAELIKRLATRICEECYLEEYRDGSFSFSLTSCERILSEELGPMDRKLQMALSAIEQVLECSSSGCGVLCSSCNDALSDAIASREQSL